MRTPVEGTNESLVLVTLDGRFPVLAVTHVGYTAVAVVVSLVIAALFAFVAVVAVSAFPVSAPTKVVDVTEVRPARVVDDAPREIAVDPIVTDEFVSPAFGIVATDERTPDALVVTYPAVVRLVSRFPVTVSVPVIVVFPVIPKVAFV